MKHMVGRCTNVEELPILEELSQLENSLIEQAYCSNDRINVQLNLDSALEELCSLGPECVDFFVKRVHTTKEEVVDVFKRTRQLKSLFWRMCRQVRVYIFFTILFIVTQKLPYL